MGLVNILYQKESSAKKYTWKNPSIEFLLHCSLHCRQEGHSDLKRLLKRRQSMTSSCKAISIRHHDLPHERGPLAKEGDDGGGEISQSLFFPRERVLPTCFKFTSKCHRMRRSSSVMVIKKDARIARNAARLSKGFDSFSNCLPPSWFRFRNASESHLSRFSHRHCMYQESYLR